MRTPKFTSVRRLARELSADRQPRARRVQVGHLAIHAHALIARRAEKGHSLVTKVQGAEGVDGCPARAQAERGSDRAAFGFLFRSRSRSGRRNFRELSTNRDAAVSEKRY